MKLLTALAIAFTMNLGIAAADPISETMRKVTETVSKPARAIQDKLSEVGSEVNKHANNAVKDVTKGPGPTNDATGRQGWLRQRLGF